MAQFNGQQETEFTEKNKIRSLTDSENNSSLDVQFTKRASVGEKSVDNDFKKDSKGENKNAFEFSIGKGKMDNGEAASNTALFSRRAYVTVAILFFINLLNYMDRFTIAGVLPAVQEDFKMTDAESGLLQTMFICAYMVFAPIFGYLGDRYPRKWIMIVGIFIWSATVMASTFVPNNLFVVFLLCRGVVGIGEASYSTVASTLIADLFTKDMRTRMLMIFYFAIPVGSGLGFMVGSSVASLFPEKDVGWRWGVRVTPFFGIVCLLLLIFVLKEPNRGESERVTNLQSSSWFSDLTYLVKNKSFVWTTLAFTCVTFASGSLSWWGPSFIELSEKAQMKKPDSAEIGFVFGIITCIAGFGGVTIGSVWAQLWRKTNSKADPLVCGIGILASVPFMYVALTFAQACLPVAYVAVFFAVLCLSLNWALVSDILMYIITPTRRSTASAFQILFSHLLGDAASPYLIGVVSDAIRDGSDSDAARFTSLKYAMYIPCFVLVIGGFFFLGTAWYVEADRRATELLAKGHEPSMPIVVNGSSDGYGGVGQSVGSMHAADSQAYLVSPDDDQPLNDSAASIRYRF